MGKPEPEKAAGIRAIAALAKDTMTPQEAEQMESAAKWFENGGDEE